ncbi:fam-c protein [Plasmodium vinckei brucechwatti]|uniref:Fam-c protein n=1 Tax=Plasmodium vinckei brucechwatti TaxID=119398 RepID=A0A6V7SFG4_PLAVN|nr:fam-c protein [Plasmodium vinckei brucechwatti]
MNKRVFSLVCIALYVFLAVLIQCSEQKTSGLRSRIIRAIKQIKRSSKKNDT